MMLADEYLVFFMHKLNSFQLLPSSNRWDEMHHNAGKRELLRGLPTTVDSPSISVPSQG